MQDSRVHNRIPPSGFDAARIRSFGSSYRESRSSGWSCRGGVTTCQPWRALQIQRRRMRNGRAARCALGAGPLAREPVGAQRLVVGVDADPLLVRLGEAVLVAAASEGEVVGRKQLRMSAAGARI